MTALLVVGAILELGGILLVGSPDLVPGARRLSIWVGGRVDRAARRVLRAVRIRRPRHISVGVASEINVAGHVAGLIHSTTAKSLEEKVAFLLRRDEKQQRALSELNTRLADLEKDFGRRLDAQRSDLEAHVRDEIAAERSEYRWARILGALALIAGLVCVTVAQVM